MKTITLQEVAQHNTKDDLWIVIHGKVYDLTKFLPEHPGGPRIIMKYAGQDATDAFDPIHPPDIIDRYLSAEACMGEINEEELEATEKVETEEQMQSRIAHENKPNLDEMLNAFDFEGVAKTVLKPEAWAYYSSGADDEITLRENHSAFHRIWLKPRVMVDVEKVDMSTSLLGTKSSMPLYITATALGKLGHPDGEKVLTVAAAEQGVIQMIPTLASCSFNELIETRAQNQTQWFQLYVNKDRAITEKLVRHAEASGVKGLFITVDAPQLGRREKDMRQKYSADDPEELVKSKAKVTRSQGAARAISSFIDPALSWKDIKWFRSITNMPILLKGVQTAEDAVLAARYGCQGVVLSNHGGRQLDFAPSAIEILPEVMDALKLEGLDKNFEVYVDGGIRRGTDIFKAIALGAKGVGIGRPALYAMSSYGVDGVVKLIQLLKDELEMVMRLMGTPTIADIKPDMVDIRNIKSHAGSFPSDNLAAGVYENMRTRVGGPKL
ncbi:FMN-dependent dehydrogenase-domain-containing protein [Umbelopsis sp. PMI_123]|nr:FMN-dependent dehydrogenase-domain-containing protein [Umbelopsis sp. PMI_123]